MNTTNTAKMLLGFIYVGIYKVIYRTYVIIFFLSFVEIQIISITL